MLTSHYFTLFLLHSYIIGWIMVARKATEWPYVVDLCQFLRMMVLAVFPTTLLWLVTVFVAMNFALVLSCLAFGIAGAVVLGLLGYFVVRPVVNKVVSTGSNALNTFHNKFCVVLYKK